MQITYFQIGETFVVNKRCNCMTINIYFNSLVIYKVALWWGKSITAGYILLHSLLPNFFQIYSSCQTHFPLRNKVYKWVLHKDHCKNQNKFTGVETAWVKVYSEAIKWNILPLCLKTQVLGSWKIKILAKISEYNPHETHICYGSW